MVLILVNALIGQGISVGITLVLVGIAWGSLKAEVKYLRLKVQMLESTYVTKDDLASIKETLAEIRGMFRLELKER